MYGRREIQSVNARQRLCNRTRLPIRGRHDNCLKVAVLMGYFIGDKVNFLRSDKDPSETLQPPIVLKTEQLTLTIVFTMIANKSQGANIRRCWNLPSIFLPSHVFGIVTKSKLSSNSKSRFNFK
jgi:hypothetical protein